MSYARIIVLTALAMVAFAGNSLLCRAALNNTTIDAASFTSIRLISGAVVLWLLVRLRFGPKASAGNWRSGLALFVYAAAFSFAYVSLPAATGALLIFGAVQATMISRGIWAGERLGKLQLLGMVLAFAGLLVLLFPGVSSAPPLGGALLMMVSGISWGIYSLRGQSAGDPIRVTAGNFLRAVPMTALLSLLMIRGLSLDAAGVIYAVASGGLASAIGYAIWYTALPGLKATQAATVQLTVPVIATLGGIALLGEPVSLRLALASVAILGGIALTVLDRQRVNGQTS